VTPWLLSHQICSESPGISLSAGDNIIIVWTFHRPVATDFADHLADFFIDSFSYNASRTIWK